MNINHNFEKQIKEAKDFMDSQLDRISYKNFIENYTPLSGKGIVYFIFVTDKNTKETSLKYIGKSKANLFKTRFTNHFDHAHERNGNQMLRVHNELSKGNTVELSYLTTEPESLRNLIEEELLNTQDKAKLWNGKGRNVV